MLVLSLFFAELLKRLSLGCQKSGVGVGFGFGSFCCAG
ncbi:MAG: hypothetical protein ACI93T_004174, partial [Porticoccaceae bacterium]